MYVTVTCLFMDSLIILHTVFVNAKPWTWTPSKESQDNLRYISNSTVLIIIIYACNWKFFIISFSTYKIIYPELNGVVHIIIFNILTRIYWKYLAKSSEETLVMGRYAYKKGDKLVNTFEFFFVFIFFMWRLRWDFFLHFIYLIIFQENSLYTWYIFNW